MLQWNDQWLKKVEQRIGQRVEAAAIHLQNEIRTLISIPSRTVTLKEGRNGKIKRVLGPRGSSRSKAGEPPHMDHGNLRRSIAHDYDSETLTARVGSPLRYSRYLEMGTAKMAARPFLRRALKENTEKIRQIIEHGAASSVKVGD